jgi:ABC-type lipoprotein export system ATPase subunit/SAM-dependent methyltransferase
MRISKLKIEKALTDEKRLKEIDLTKKPFGSTVALVGKNGAGKSRILKFVETYFTNLTLEDLNSDFVTNIPTTLTGNFLEQITKLKVAIEKLRATNPSQQQQIQQYNQSLVSLNTQYLQRVKQLGQAYIKVVDNDDLKNIKASINSNAAMTFESILTNSHFDNLVNNPNLATSNAQQQQQSGVLLNEFTAFNSQSTIKYLGKLSNEILTDQVNLYLAHSDNLELINSEIKKKNSYKLFNTFQGYVKQFMGKEFSYKQRTQGNTINSVLYFDNNPFDVNLLSPGQKTLFAYAILFFFMDTNSKTNIKDSIIIIDEPEKHLHPEAQITLINALKNIVSKSGQLWIATHSINILSHLDYDEIIMIKDDEIIPPSRTTPGHSFNDLMGLDEHITELVAFISSISEWAYGNFMVQCFKEPDVIFSNDVNDPQYKLFKDFITTKPQIALLDFGAGKGRIGYTIGEDEKTRTMVQYFAYEPDKGNFDLLSKVPDIKNFYQNTKDIPDNTFDCVLLCNVLHEINPNEWEETFNQIKRTLKRDGYLLIIEDKFLPKGENAHEFGYLILGSEQLKLLFKPYFSSDLKVFELSLKDEKYKNRIVFTAFTKGQINISENNIKDAIKSLKETSFNNIKALRKQDKDINQGRQYANQTQLYINAQLALEVLN